MRVLDAQARWPTGAQARGAQRTFFAACFVLLRSFTSRSAASRAAARTSGFWVRLALMISSDMPTTALVPPLDTLRD